MANDKRIKTHTHALKIQQNGSIFEFNSGSISYLWYCTKWYTENKTTDMFIMICVAPKQWWILSRLSYCWIPYQLGIHYALQIRSLYKFQHQTNLKAHDRCAWYKHSYLTNFHLIFIILHHFVGIFLLFLNHIRLVLFDK